MPIHTFYIMKSTWIFLRVVVIFLIAVPSNGEAPCTVASFSFDHTEVKENEIVHMECSVTGDPVPTFSIRNKDTGETIAEARETSSTVSVDHAAKCLDSGMYECTGYNKLNTKNSTKSENLAVQCPPRVDSRHGDIETFSASIGDNLDMTVYYLASPFPSFTWIHQGGVIPAGKKEDKKESDSLTTTLKLTNIQIADFGEYDITVQNKHGTLQSKVYLVGNGPPGSPTSLRVTNESYDSVDLEWYSGFDYFLKQTFLLHYRTDSSSEWNYVDVVDTTDHGQVPATHTVSDLNQDTLYYFQVSSKNIYGEGSASNNVTFHTPSVTNGMRKRCDISSIYLLSTIICLSLCKL